MKTKRPPIHLILSLCLAACLCVFAEAAAAKPNVLLLCIDDLRPELNCFGKSYIKSPHIDRLAERGVAFHRHYVTAPTCGASRFTLLTGRYGSASNGALFQRAAAVKKDAAKVPDSMPAHFRKQGYITVSIGKVSHHPGGWGGEDWDDKTQLEMPHSWDRRLMPCGPWKHPRGAMHGLANGEIRGNARNMAVFQATEGGDEIYPDGLITNGALEQLDLLKKENKPFFLAVGIIRPHLPFGAPAKYLKLYEGVKLPPIPHPTKPASPSTWHKSGEFMKYKRWGKDPNKDAAFATEVRRHYAACVSYADAQVGRVLAKLKEIGATDNTIVVVWGDHGWHLGEHGIWGKHCLFEEALRSPLVIVKPGMEKAGQKTNAIVSTVDIFPTLCELTGVPIPDHAHGRSLQPILQKPDSKGEPAVSYWGKADTIRTGTHRLIYHKKGPHELYDHTTPEGETKNLAPANPKLVEELHEMLKKKLATR